MTGPADYGPPSDRPQLDLTLLAVGISDAVYRRMPPEQVAHVLANIRRAVTSTNQQQAMIEVATQVLGVLLKVALV